MENAITPEEFAKRMKYIAEAGEDEELTHMAMDGLICEVLDSLGYSDGVEIFNNTSKYYA